MPSTGRLPPKHAAVAEEVRTYVPLNRSHSCTDRDQRMITFETVSVSLRHTNTYFTSVEHVSGVSVNFTRS